MTVWEGDIRCEIYYISDRASGRMHAFFHSLSLSLLLAGWMLVFSLSFSLYSMLLCNSSMQMCMCVCCYASNCFISVFSAAST